MERRKCVSVLLGNGASDLGFLVRHCAYIQVDKRAEPVVVTARQSIHFAQYPYAPWRTVSSMPNIEKRYRSHDQRFVSNAQDPIATYSMNCSFRIVCWGRQIQCIAKKVNGLLAQDGRCGGQYGIRAAHSACSRIACFD